MRSIREFLESAGRNPPSFESGFLPPFFVAAIAAAVYANTFSHGFVFDDESGILNSPKIIGARNLSQAALLLGESWRPLTQFSYALTICIFGPDARAFHITNILIHAINSVLVFGIARLLARRWLGGETAGVFALAAALIHATHPLYSEAVSYIWGRSSSLCALFYFGSLLAAMRGCEEPGRKKYFWYAASALSGILAWGSKEEAITLPWVIAGFFALVGSRRIAATILVVPLGLVFSRWKDVMELYREVQQNKPLVSAGAAPTLEPFAYFLTSVKVSVCYYLRLFVFPLGQSVDPEVRPVTGIADPALLFAATVLTLLAVWMILVVRRNRLVAFALLAFLASPLTAYTLIPLADVAAEHRVYTAGLGFELLAALLLVKLSRYRLAVVVAVVLVLSALTVQRNQVWAGSLTLWQATVQKSPGLARPHLNLGLAYQSAGRLDDALREYRHALSINPRLAPAYINIAGIHFSQNDLDAAATALERAIEVAPSLSDPYIDLAVITLRRNKAGKALEFIEKASSLGDSYLIHLNKGDVLSKLGRYDDAVREYERAVEMRPDLSDLNRQIETRLQWLRDRRAIR